MKRKMRNVKHAFIIVSVVAVGTFSAYHTHGHIQSGAELLLTNNVEALSKSENSNNSNLKYSGSLKREMIEVETCSGCGIDLGYQSHGLLSGISCAFSSTIKRKIPGHYYDCDGGDRQTQAECYAIMTICTHHAYPDECNKRKDWKCSGLNK